MRGLDLVVMIISREPSRCYSDYIHRGDNPLDSEKQEGQQLAGNSPSAALVSHRVILLSGPTKATKSASVGTWMADLEQ